MPAGCGDRYIGRAKTHLQLLATAAAINIQRIGAHFAESACERPRTSAFARLMATAAPA